MLFIKLFIDDKKNHVNSLNISYVMMQQSLCYDAKKLKKIVKFYVPTWTLFAGPVTYVTGFERTRLPRTQQEDTLFTITR